MGRIMGVTAKPSGGAGQSVVSSIAYEPFGPYSGLTYGNGVAESRGFDQDYRLTTLTDTGSSPLQNLTYAYYPTNNVKTITDAVNATNSQSFIYDNLQRLSAATGGYGSYGYTYDNDGNRLTQTLGGVTTNYGIGAGNDLLQTLSMGGVTTQTVGYTGDGRIANLSPGIQAPGGQYITSLSYNQDGRMSAVNASGGALASYTYDGFGQRLLKTFSSTNGQIYQYGQNGMLLEETNQSGAAQADYIYLESRPIATLDPNSGTLYYLHDDLLGTPQLATDGGQTVAWQSTYKPFGQASVSGTVTQNLRFPGQYFDVESGWNHNGFRDYIPDLGRYAEPDPLAMQGNAKYLRFVTGYLISGLQIGLMAGTNPYAYVDDAPTSMVDLLGLAGQQAPHNNPPPGCTFPSCFWYYGNWGGPGWSGGQWKPLESLTPEEAAKLAPPIDPQDACYMHHDYCYSHSRQRHGGRSCSRDEGECDRTLAQCLRNAAESNPRSYNPASAASNQWFMLSSWWKSIDWNSVVQVLGSPTGPLFLSH